MAWSYAPVMENISELHNDGFGWNDCAQAAMARYLYEDGEFSITYPALSAIRDLCFATRGRMDSPDNPVTRWDQIVAGLARYGKHFEVASMGSDAARIDLHSWAILAVDATLLAPANYPASWLGRSAGTSNHILLVLPSLEGDTVYVNDPLLGPVSRGQAIYGTTYSKESVLRAFYWGGNLLGVPQKAPINAWKRVRLSNRAEAVLGTGQGLIGGPSYAAGATVLCGGDTLSWGTQAYQSFWTPHLLQMTRGRPAYLPQWVLTGT